MNLLLVEPGELTGDVARLTGRRARHLREVLHVTPGQRLRAGIAGRAAGHAVVEAVDEQQVVLRMCATGAPLAPPPVHLVLAVPRPKALRRILRVVGALGVAALDLVNAWRVDRSYLSSGVLEPAALRRELLLGCEQAGTTWVPPVSLHRRLMAWFEAAEPALPALRAIAHPRAQRALEELVLPGTNAPVALAIGPDGGWIDRELATFAAAGFVAVHSGAPVLRGETAIVALLAQLALLRRL